jgi:hypothetical protein
VPAPPINPNHIMNGVMDKIRQRALANPVAWFLFILLVVAEYGNYRHGKELTRVCELTGPHDVASRVPRNDREELDNICISRQSDD